MTKYAILRKAKPGEDAVRSLEAFGPGSGGKTISFESLTARDVASIAAEPEVEVVAPTMPIRLIKPLASTVGVDAADWGLTATGAATSAYDGTDVKVAVLDTGIEAEHAAFAGVAIEQKDFSGDGDGDRQGHGTHCAGTIFGRDVAGHRIGVARGVTEAFIGKVLKDDGSGDSEMIFSGLQWALSKKANIISMSLGFDFPGMVERLVADQWPADLATSNALEAYRGNLRMFDAIMRMAKAMAAFGDGALIFAAAGNESRREQHQDWKIAASLPAAADDVISVAAIGRKGQDLVVAPFSNSMAVLAGPGVDITSAWPGGGLKTISGTSMACPLVAGLAALWWHSIRDSGKKPTPVNVKAALVNRARREPFGVHADEADIGQGLAMAP